MPPPEQRRLIVFTRYPRPGSTKTRLIPALGAEGAARLQRAMTEFTLAQARLARAAAGCEVEVRFHGGSSERMQEWLGTDVRYRPQGDGDLGAKMARAFGDCFDAGVARVLIVGTDCPGLTAAVVGRAFDALSAHELVLGPARDGGYYLIGLCRPAPRLFRGMVWGGADVLARTRAAAARAGLATAELDVLDDIDRPEDLHLHTHPQGEDRP